MFANPDSPLELHRLREEPTSSLRSAIKTWLIKETPTCLIHPHGFYVVLIGRTDTEEWRLHFWPKGPRFITGMPAFIHTHNCRIDSRILQGQLTNILYSVSVDSNGSNPLYQVEYGGDRYTAVTSNHLRRTELRVRSAPLKRDTYVCGDSYGVERNAYHEAVVSDQESTSTLVCMHGRSADPVMVVGLDGYPPTLTFTRPEYRGVDFAEWI